MNEVVDERLMTIADLWTMLRVPIDTLYGWRPALPRSDKIGDRERSIWPGHKVRWRTLREYGMAAKEFGRRIGYRFGTL
jgi:hypothetical protein